MVNTLWGWRLMLLKGFHNLQYHLRIYINKRRKSKEEFNTSWNTLRLALLKDLPKPLRPFKVYMTLQQYAYLVTKSSNEIFFCCLISILGDTILFVTKYKS
jgi:hypothetical protein